MKAKGVLTAEQRKFLLNRIDEIFRTNPPGDEDENNAELARLRKQQEEISGKIDRIRDRIQKKRQAMLSLQYKSANFARKAVHFSKSEEAAIKAVDELEKLCDGWVSRGR